MRATTVLRKLLGLRQAVVVCSGELADAGGDAVRPRLVVTPHPGRSPRAVRAPAVSHGRAA